MRDPGGAGNGRAPCLKRAWPARWIDIANDGDLGLAEAVPDRSTSRA